MTTPSNDGKTYWLDDMRNVRKIVWGLVFACAGLFVADAFYQKHAYFSAENWFGFYALYGFFMCVGLVLAAKVMRILLMRGEDYYDKEGDND